MGLNTKPPPLHPALGPPKHEHHFEDEYFQQHFEMNLHEHEVRTSSAGNFDKFD
jgi:hypothetical protein